MRTAYSWLALSLVGATWPIAAAAQCYYYETKIVDPVPSLLSDASITTDRNALSQQGREVGGVAADGVAKVVIRVRLPHASQVTVAFSLEGAPGTTGVPTEDGSLSSVDAQTATAAKVSVQSDEVDQVQWAFAIYHAPLDFARARTDDASRRTRDLTVRYRVNNDTEWCSTAIQIHRPLVFPVHGIWSSSLDTWSGFAPLINNGAPDPRFTIAYADYKDLTSGPIVVSATKVGTDLESALKADKDQRRIAAVQADVIAHSLGGVVARALPTLMRHTFVRPDNYRKGDMHKLITIASPHMGARVATHIQDAINRGSPALSLVEWFFGGMIGVADPFTSGAVAELRPLSELYQRIGADTHVPTHHIVGRATARDKTANKIISDFMRYVTTGCPPNLPGKFGWAGIVCDALVGSGFTLIFGNFDHDLFIEESSQKDGGYVYGRNAAVYTDLVHTSIFRGTAETRSPAAASWVIALLNNQTKGIFFMQPNASAPMLETADASTGGMGTLPSTEPLPSTASLPAQPSMPSPHRMPATATTTVGGGIRIVSPLNGASVNAGDTIAVEVEPIGDASLAFVFGHAGQELAFTDAAPFRFSLLIPNDAVGPRTLSVLAGGLSDDTFVDRITLNVRAPSTLTALTTLVPSVTLPAPGLQARISVLGTFADGATRDVTRDAATIWESSDPAVAMVDRGTVTAMRQGSAAITIANAGRTASVSVTVGSGAGLSLADLEIVNTAPPGPAPAGSTITYTVTVTNRGPSTASAVAVSDVISENTTFVSCVSVTAAAACDASGDSRTMTLASLAAGASATMTLVVTVNPSLVADTVIVNRAHASASTLDPTLSNNAAAATTLAHAIALPPPPSPQPPPSPPPVPAPSPDPGAPPSGLVTRYFAEGATGSFFECRLALLNPGTTPASVLLRFLKEDATTVSHQMTIPAGARRTVMPAELSGLEGASFSTLIESDAFVVADRSMTWGGGYGSHAESALQAPATTWYLAEGATGGGFHLFHLLQNPNGTPTTVNVRFLRPAGAPIVRSYDLPALSRTTLYVKAIDPALEATDVSAVFEATQPIIVERAMYLDRPGEPFGAGHGSAGVTAPALTWFFAEGATGPFFDLYILLANPGDRPATVEMKYLTSNAEVFTKTHDLAPDSRTTIWVDQESIPGLGQVLANAAVSTTVTSVNGVPIIAERAMWWPEGQWYEAHNSPGATSTGTRWALADGEAGGPAGVQTYVLIANTSGFAGRVRVTLHFEDGATAERVYDLMPHSRTNVPVGADFPESDGRRFGVVIESLGDAQAQIVVERAMYANAGGVVWAAGTNALATRLP